MAASDYYVSDATELAKIGFCGHPEDMFHPSSVVGCYLFGGTPLYLVNWAGWGFRYLSWESVLTAPCRAKFEKAGCPQIRGRSLRFDANTPRVWGDDIAVEAPKFVTYLIQKVRPESLLRVRAQGKHAVWRHGKMMTEGDALFVEVKLRSGIHWDDAADLLARQPELAERLGELVLEAWRSGGKRLPRAWSRVRSMCPAALKLPTRRPPKDRVVANPWAGRTRKRRSPLFDVEDVPERPKKRMKVH